MDSSLLSFILTGWKVAGGENKLCKKMGKRLSCEYVVLAHLHIDALIKIMSKLLTTCANSTGQRVKEHFFFLKSGICLCLLWHPQLAGTQTAPPPPAPLSKHGSCKNNKDARADVFPLQRLAACLSGVNQRINRGARRGESDSRNVGEES